MNADAKADALAVALTSFRKEGQLVDLSTEPQYPGFLVVVPPDDESADETWLPSELLKQAFDEQPSSDDETADETWLPSELLKQAFDEQPSSDDETADETWLPSELLKQAFDEQPSSDDETADETWLPSELLKQASDEQPSSDPEWTLIAKTRSPSGRSAVYEYETAAAPNPPLAAPTNHVFQITDVAPTRQITSVVGRIGAITILARKLAAALLQIDPSLPDELSIGDLARLATHNTPDTTERVERLLRRANNGRHITGQKLDALAQFLCVAPRELAFDHPGIYDREARKRGRQHRNRKSRYRLDELAVHPVTKMERLAAGQA